MYLRILLDSRARRDRAAGKSSCLHEQEPLPYVKGAAHRTRLLSARNRLHISIQQHKAARQRNQNCGMLSGCELSTSRVRLAAVAELDPWFASAELFIQAS